MKISTRIAKIFSRFLPFEEKDEVLHTLLRAKYIWEWLRDHPGETKEQAYQALGLAPEANFCPACAFIYAHNAGCEECPIWRNGTTCLQAGSPYMMWAMARGKCAEQETAAAQGVIALIDRRIAERVVYLDGPKTK